MRRTPLDNAVMVKRHLMRILKARSVKNAIKALTMVKKYDYALYYLSKETAEILTRQAMAKWRDYYSYWKMDESLPLEGMRPGKWVDMTYDYAGSQRAMAIACSEYLRSVNPECPTDIGFLPPSTPTHWAQLVTTMGRDPDWWEKYGLKYLDDINIILTLQALDEKMSIVFTSYPGYVRQGYSDYLENTYLSTLTAIKAVFLSRIEELNFGAAV